MKCCLVAEACFPLASARAEITDPEKGSDLPIGPVQVQVQWINNEITVSMPDPDLFLFKPSAFFKGTVPVLSSETEGVIKLAQSIRNFKLYGRQI